MADIAPLNGMSEKKKDRMLVGLIRRRRRDNMMAKITGRRVVSGATTVGTAIAGGFIWAKFPQIRRLGAGAGRAGIDTRFVVGGPLLLASLHPKTPGWVQAIGETFMVPALWDFGESIGT